MPHRSHPVQSGCWRTRKSIPCSASQGYELGCSGWWFWKLPWWIDAFKIDTKIKSLLWNGWQKLLTVDERDKTKPSREVHQEPSVYTMLCPVSTSGSEFGGWGHSFILHILIYLKHVLQKANITLALTHPSETSLSSNKGPFQIVFYDPVEKGKGSPLSLALLTRRSREHLSDDVQVRWWNKKCVQLSGRWHWECLPWERGHLYNKYLKCHSDGVLGLLTAGRRSQNRKILTV